MPEVKSPDQADMLRHNVRHSNDNSSSSQPRVMASPPGPFDEVRQVVEQFESVVGISGNLCQRPHNQEKDYAFFMLDLHLSQENGKYTEEGKSQSKSQAKTTNAALIGLVTSVWGVCKCVGEKT